MSSDEEEMRRVRAARGFKTRAERALDAQPSNIARNAADRARAEFVRRAARRATMERAELSSSSEDERDSGEAQSGGAQSRNLMIPDSGASANAERSTEAGNVAKVEGPLHQQRPSRFPEQQQLQKPCRVSATAQDSSSEEDDVPGPRPLSSAAGSTAMRNFPTTHTHKEYDSSTNGSCGSCDVNRNRDSNRNSSSISTDSSCNSLGRGEGEEASRHLLEEQRQGTGLTPSTTETAPAVLLKGSVLEDDCDFLFEQLPEEDDDKEGVAEREETAATVEDRENVQREEEDEEVVKDDEQKEGDAVNEDKEVEDSQSLAALLRLQQQQRKQQRDEESSEEDDEDMSAREALGLPVTFGYTGAVQHKRLQKRHTNSSSSGAAGSLLRQRNGIISEEISAASGAEVEAERFALKRWSELGLPASQTLIIPTHCPATVTALAVNAMANRMATGGSDGLLRLWDFQGLSSSTAFQLQSTFHSYSLTPSNSSQSRKSDSLSDHKLDPTYSHTSHASKLKLSHDSQGKTAGFTSHTSLKRETALESAASSVATSAAQSYRVIAAAERHRVQAAAFSSVRKDLLLLAAGDAVCRVYSAAAADLMLSTTQGDMYLAAAAATKGHTHAVLDCCWHPLEHNLFISAAADGTVRVWDMLMPLQGMQQTLPSFLCFRATFNNSSIIRSTNGKDSSRFSSSSIRRCSCLAVAPTSAGAVVVGCGDGSLQMWGGLKNRKVGGKPDAIVPQSHSLFSKFDRAVGESNFSSAAAAATGDDSVTADDAAVAHRTVVHSSSATAAPAAEAGGVGSVCFFRNDWQLVTRGASDACVALWDIRRFQQPIKRQQQRHYDSTSSKDKGSLCISPDGKYICITTAAADLTAQQHIWSECPAAAATAAAATLTSAVEVLAADTLQPVATLPVPPSFQSSYSSNSCSRAARAMNREALQVIWPEETNQLLVGCSDGNLCAFFDMEMSRKGVVLLATAAEQPERRISGRRFDATSELMYAQPYIFIPGDLPAGYKETRDGQIIKVKPRGRERERLFLSTQKTIIPPMPAKEGYAGACVGGGNRSQHLLRQLGLLQDSAGTTDGQQQKQPGDDDPVAALRAYAEKTEAAKANSQLISRAYARTQPATILQYEEEETAAAGATSATDWHDEESKHERLLQQRARCPRCALRMCQCGFMQQSEGEHGDTGTRTKRMRV